MMSKMRQDLDIGSGKAAKEQASTSAAHNIIKPFEQSIYQFKITLLDIKPPIWRRIQVPYTYNFWELHVAIEDAMGWKGQHSHIYKIADPLSSSKATNLVISDMVYEDIWDSNDIIVQDTEVFLHKYFTAKNNTSLYCYRIESLWDLKVTMEKCSTAEYGVDYPRCVDGRGGSPIEHCGHLWAFKEILKVLRNPQVYYDYCKQMVEVAAANANYDVRSFDCKSVTFNNPIKRWEKKYLDLAALASRREDTVGKYGFDGGIEVQVEGIANYGHNNGKPFVNQVQVFQFKVTLDEYNDQCIWRRIQVPKHYTFWEFHIAIQDAIGWKDLNAHFFKMPNTQGIEHVISLDDDECIWDMNKVRTPEEYVYIDDYFTLNNKCGKYIYNIRAHWTHKIVLEKLITAPEENSADYPKCIEGQGASPLDDFGYKMPNIGSIDDDDDDRMLVSYVSKMKLDVCSAEFIQFTDPKKRWIQKCLEDGDIEQHCNNNLNTDVDIISDYYDDHRINKEYVYQFKISLSGLKPIIWRRIQIRANATFWDLHVALQDAMGWGHHGIHRFDMMNPRTQAQDTLIVTVDNQVYHFPKSIKKKPVPEEMTKLYTYFTPHNRVAWYELDYIDLWRHKITFEKVLIPMNSPNFPQCTGGKWGCPLIGSGGNTKYGELLAILNNPNHKEYASCMKWIKRTISTPFQPEIFDIKTVIFNNPKQMLKLISRCLVESEETKPWCTPFNLQATPAERLIYQFKIVLRPITPPIWRRVQIPANFTFWEFHVALQDAMGWKGKHAHQFDITEPNAKEISLVTLNNHFMDAMHNLVPEGETKLCDYFSPKKTAAVYLYDFVSGWFHDVTLERILPRDPSVQYPICIAGERSCPVENCGGLEGYTNLMNVVHNRYDPEFGLYTNWLERNHGEYNPEFFDPSAVQWKDPKEQWEHRVCFTPA